MKAIESAGIVREPVPAVPSPLRRVSDVIASVMSPLPFAFKIVTIVPRGNATEPLAGMVYVCGVPLS